MKKKSTKSLVKKVYTDFLASVKHDYYDEDELFDLQHDLVTAIVDSEYPGVISDKEEADEELWRAVESTVSDISEKIRRNQTDERTEKMVRLTVKRARSILDRIKPRETVIQ